jgi:hypothetical protein
MKASIDLAQQALAIGRGNVDLAQPEPGHGERIH